MCLQQNLHRSIFTAICGTRLVRSIHPHPLKVILPDDALDRVSELELHRGILRGKHIRKIAEAVSRHDHFQEISLLCFELRSFDLSVQIDQHAQYIVIAFEALKLAPALDESRNKPLLAKGHIPPFRSVHHGTITPFSLFFFSVASPLKDSR